MHVRFNINKRQRQARAEHAKTSAAPTRPGKTRRQRSRVIEVITEHAEDRQRCSRAPTAELDPLIRFTYWGIEKKLLPISSVSDFLLDRAIDQVAFRAGCAGRSDVIGIEACAVAIMMQNPSDAEQSTYSSFLFASSLSPFPLSFIGIPRVRTYLRTESLSRPRTEGRLLSIVE